MHDPGKDTRDGVNAALKDGGSPSRLSQIVCQHLSYSARASKEPHTAIIAVVRGGLNAAYLGNADLPETAILVLKALPDLSLMMRTDPQELMSWVLEGIADAAVNAGPAVRDKISVGIEDCFHGAGPVFDDLCQKAQAAKG